MGYNEMGSLPNILTPKDDAPMKPFSGKKGSALVVRILTGWLLLSLACQLPGNILQKEPTPAGPAQNATPHAVQTATPAPPLPPAISETLPPAGDVIGAADGVMLLFSQGMDATSVEAALSISPDLSHTLEWISDRQVQIHFDQLPPDQRITISLAESAASLDGLRMTAPVSLEYLSPSKFLVTNSIPASASTNVTTDSAVIINFNQPVVGLGADPASLPTAFELEPASYGRGEWLNTSTYVFHPEPALLPATTYSVKVNTSLTSLYGSALEDNGFQEWSFTTGNPMITSVSPLSQLVVDLDQVFTVEFNQRMEPTSVEQNFFFRNADGTPVIGVFRWNDAFTSFTFTPTALLNRDDTYTLEILQQARAYGGVPLASGILNYYYGSSALQLFEPRQGEINLSPEYNSLRLQFNNPIGGFNEDWVTITPAIDNQYVSALPENGTIYLSGYFAPVTTYTVRVDPQLVDRWGDTLDAPVTLTFTTGQARPTFVSPILSYSYGYLFMLPDDVVLPVYATNIERVQVTAGAYSISEYIAAAQGGSMNAPAGSETWSKVLNLPPNRSTGVEIPLTQQGAAREPGLYYFNVEPGASTYFNNSFMGVVSHNQILVKRSAGGATAWVVDLRDNTPVSGAVVDFYNSSAAVIASATTDADGLATIQFPATHDPEDQLYVAIGQPGDEDFSLSNGNWNSGISPWSWGYRLEEDILKPTAYVYTDRPIYRPGDTVEFRAILREEQNGRYYDFTGQNPIAVVMSSYDAITYQRQTLEEIPLSVSEYGSATGRFTIPEGSAPGFYSIEIQDIDNSSVTFQVAEYRKPEVQLTVDFDQDLVMKDQTLKATINAAYYFGAPAANLPISWDLAASPDYVFIPGGYRTGQSSLTWETYSHFSSIASDSGFTDAQGNLTVEIRLDDPLLAEIFDSGDLRTLTLTAAITDESEYPISATASLPYRPAYYLIGVRPASYSGVAGQELNYDIQTLNLQNGRAPGKVLRGSFQRVQWTHTTGSSGWVSNTVEELTEVSSVDFETDSQGRARIAFTPEDAGTYRLEIRSEDGAVTSLYTRVNGTGSVAWERLPFQQVTITSDAADYLPGQTANLFIPNPFTQKALALVTVESGELSSAQVIEVEGPGLEMPVVLTDEDAPNVYVAVTLLGVNENGNPDFRQGYQNLKVASQAHMLNVELVSNPPVSYPSGEVELTFKVTDHDGKPVQGEFSLSLIDKALLALAGRYEEEIGEAFYSTRSLGVFTGIPLTVFNRRIDLPMPAGGRGGGGDNGGAPLRENFKDTAFWNGQIVTDPDGQATVSVRLPDNLTTWVALVRGLDQDTRVGEATVEVVTTRDLIIRPQTPRFLVAGDHVELSAIANNNTNETLEAEVRLSVNGAQPDEDQPGVQTITLPPGGRQLVSWWATVLDVDAVEVTFSIRSGNLSDAAKPERGDIPVLHYSVPGTASTAGYIDQASQRQEVISIPYSFTPTGGQLHVQVSPSLSATVLKGLESQEVPDGEWTEPLLSSLLPNLSAYIAMRNLNLDDPSVEQLTTDIPVAVGLLLQLQHEDGGWGWNKTADSSLFYTTYAYMGLHRAHENGFDVPDERLLAAREYLNSQLFLPTESDTTRWLDEAAFTAYVLGTTGEGRTDVTNALYSLNHRLSPWARALLAITPGGHDGNGLAEALRAETILTATGASWQGDPGPGAYSGSPMFNTAVVTYALAQKDPAQPILVDAVRYLTAHQKINRGWGSSYTNSWVLMALTEVLRGVGDLQADYDYQVLLNGRTLLSGEAAGPDALTTVDTVAPWSEINQGGLLQIGRGEGNGRLYYRADLQISRPAESAQPTNRGILLSRQYFPADEACRDGGCGPINMAEISAERQQVLVHVSITVPRDMEYVMVEDFIPAGAEIIDPALQIYANDIATTGYWGNWNSYETGYGWWYFNDTRIYDDHITWFAEYLPAGSYELVYRINPLQAGEYRVLPAHAYQYYFPEVEGTSAGEIFTIRRDE